MKTYIAGFLCLLFIVCAAVSNPKIEIKYKISRYTDYEDFKVNTLNMLNQGWIIDQYEETNINGNHAHIVIYKYQR